MPRGLIAGLCLGVSAISAQAQSNVAFTSNDVSIEQIGTANLAAVSSSGLNNVVVGQNGQNNNVALTAAGTGNGSITAPISVEQTGEGNTTEATITGDENSLVITQNSGGAANIARVNQDGQFNDVTLTQDATGLTGGFANQAEINQTGQNNSVNATQTAFAAGASLFNNDVLVNQTGNDNIANSTQSGLNNKIEQEQVGDRNRSDITQTGDDNLAIHRQFGNDLGVPLDQGGIVIEQTGGARVLVEQYTPATAPLPQQAL